MKNIIITGKDLKLSPALKNYVFSKMKKIVKYWSGQIISIKVELDVDKNQKKGMTNRVEMSIQLPRKIIKAGLKAYNMREAIDLCLPKLTRQIKKYKTKISRNSQPGAKTIRK